MEKFLISECINFYTDVISAGTGAKSKKKREKTEREMKKK